MTTVFSDGDGMENGKPLTKRNKGGFFREWREAQ